MASFPGVKATETEVPSPRMGKVLLGKVGEAGDGDHEGSEEQEEKDDKDEMDEETLERMRQAMNDVFTLGEGEE